MADQPHGLVYAFPSKSCHFCIYISDNRLTVLSASPRKKIKKPIYLPALISYGVDPLHPTLIIVRPLPVFLKKERPTVLGKPDGNGAFHIFHFVHPEDDSCLEYMMIMCPKWSPAQQAMRYMAKAELKKAIGPLRKFEKYLDEKGLF